MLRRRRWFRSLTGPPMDKGRDHTWYRNEAKRLRDKAAAVRNDDALRNSYLSLAREYDHLADTLEDRQRGTGGEDSNHGSG